MKVRSFRSFRDRTRKFDQRRETCLATNSLRACKKNREPDLYASCELSERKRFEPRPEGNKKRNRDDFPLMLSLFPDLRCGGQSRKTAVRARGLLAFQYSFDDRLKVVAALDQGTRDAQNDDFVATRAGRCTTGVASSFPSEDHEVRH